MTKVRTTEVVVIGGGQAGLAMSQCLTSRSIDHVVLERGKTANSWRTERWDSLRLLTPNWMTRLPGWDYRGGDPDGYMTASEVTSHLDAYRRAIAAPIRCGVEVARITTTENVHHGHLIETNEGPWCSSAVVIATGACSNPRVPAIAAEMPDHVQHVTPIRYRNPSQLGDGGVLVVGASASGLQIADELSQAGRAVTLAVGDHVRLPRAYRGRDIHWWMDAIGQLDERYDEVDDIDRARRLPSLQLIGSSERRDLDLNAVAASGVRLTGRLVGRSGHRAQFSGSFANMCVSADLKQRRLLDRLDDYAALISLDAELTGPTRPEPTVAGVPTLEVDLRSIDTIVWATGFRPLYPWLDQRLLDPKGRLLHEGGVLPAPGMYVLGLPFMRRRKSSFLDGVGPDASELTEHLSGHLAQLFRRPRTSVSGCDREPVVCSEPGNLAVAVTRHRPGRLRQGLSASAVSQSSASRPIPSEEFS